MNYLYLLKALFNINLYNKYRKTIKLKQDQDKEIYFLFEALDKVMELKQDSISFEEYSVWVLFNLGQEYSIYLKLVEKQPDDIALIEKTLNTVAEKQLAYTIAETALAVSEGRKSREDLLSVFERFEEYKTIEEKENPFLMDSLEEIYNKNYKEPGLTWRLQCLNKSLGSLRKGDFGFIFARPETGKTTFLSSEITNFAEQVETPGIWFNNEEQGSKVKLKWYLSALGIPLETVAKDLAYYEAMYKEKTKNNILLFDRASIDKRDIRAICKDIQPSFVIIDQLDKITGFQGERPDITFGHKYQFARELSKEYCPVIGVCQADGTGEGKKYLTMSHVAEAKTTKQAEADWILGIGMIHDPGFELIRFLNVSKNKLLGDENTDPKLKHGKFEVLIQPQIGRYQDL